MIEVLSLLLCRSILYLLTSSHTKLVPLQLTNSNCFVTFVVRQSKLDPTIIISTYGLINNHSIKTVLYQISTYYHTCLVSKLVKSLFSSSCLSIIDIEHLEQHCARVVATQTDDCNSFEHNYAQASHSVSIVPLDTYSTSSTSFLSLQAASTSVATLSHRT